MAETELTSRKKELSREDFIAEMLDDYRLAWQSRQASLLARKEVLRGKAKFGIMGAGKELPQLALSKFFNKGDFRAGYYRDQTWALACGMTDIKEMFALLYGNPDINKEPNSAGRQMSSHFGTRLLDENGEWKDQTQLKNTSSDVAPTASQMGRAVGLALASKLYRHYDSFDSTKFSKNGNEVLFASIGDASTSEGIFWEAVNSIGVMQIPAVISVWDDGYGISVPKKFQTTKASISTALSGFARDENSPGYNIFTVKAWDYPALLKAYERAVTAARELHIPAIVHVEEVTQPQGHSTSGSHERYKDENRLKFEQEFDCIQQFGDWLISKELATAEELKSIENQALEDVKKAMKLAWEEKLNPVKAQKDNLLEELSALNATNGITKIITELNKHQAVGWHHVDRAAKQALQLLRKQKIDHNELKQWVENYNTQTKALFNSALFTNSNKAALKVDTVIAEYSTDKVLNGFEILQHCFDSILGNNPNVVAFGEDLGKIGGVNQGFAGLQEKHGDHRVWDVGIREGTIMGQAMGLAMRGFKPIAEIQYLDYILYGLQQLSDEVATLSYRTAGGQKAPLIVRTRGHRLEGIWHTGSPLQLILGSLRGMHVCVPRNMTQAAGFYNTLIASDEPGLVIEPLNGYRLKEKLPSNLAHFRLALGQVETITQGEDVTLVTYGSCVRIAEEAVNQLSSLGISVELIDVQSMLPFDLEHDIVKSLAKTNRIVFLDEDVPGGATSFMLQQVLEKQGGYEYLDSKPLTITAKEHRAGYGAEYNHFSKPQTEDIVEDIYALMHEVNPKKFPM